MYDHEAHERIIMPRLRRDDRAWQLLASREAPRLVLLQHVERRGGIWTDLLAMEAE